MLDASGSASVTAAQLFGGATDNCDVDLNSVTINDNTFDCSDISAGSSAADALWINEFHYDNTGGDIGEFVEIAGSAGLDLAGYDLVFV